MTELAVVKEVVLAQWRVLVPLLFLTFVISQWVWFRQRNRELLRLAAKLPIPAPLKPILGNFYNYKSRVLRPVINNEEFTHTMRLFLKAAAEKPYSQFCMWMGPKPYIFIQKPEDAKIILNSSKSINKGSEVGNLRFILGDGLVTANGVKWKTSRRYMNPVFHHANVQNLTAIFNQNGHQLVEDLAGHLDGDPFDVFDYTFKASLNSTCAVVFGLETQSQMKKNDFDLGASISLRFGDYAGLRVVSPWLWHDRTFHFFFKKKLKDLEETWTQLKNQAFKTNDHENFCSVRTVYNTILQEEHDLFSEASMDDQMKTILFTGSDSTANGLGSILMLLGKHQHVQDKLYNEITSSLGSESEEVTIQDVNSLPYLDQVIKECLRISPVVMFYQRQLSEEIQLSECTLPKGVNAIVSVIGLHFDPEVYPDPYVFNPENFSPENVAKRHPYSYLPFSGGPRSCIGKHYALSSIKIAMVYLLRAYKVHSSKSPLDLDYTYTVSVRPIDGYEISLERRIK